MFVDIGIIAILLIGFIVGLVRGTAKSIIKLISLIAGIILTWYLTPFIMKFVFDTDILNELILGDGVSLKVLFKDTKIATLYEGSIILKAIYSPLSKQVTDILATAGNSLTAEQCLPYVLAMYSATVIVSFLVYLVVRLLIMIIAAIIKAIFLKYKPGGLSRFIGGLFGIINSTVTVLWIFLLTSSVISLPQITQPIADQTKDSKGVQFVYGYVQQGFNTFIVKDDYIQKAMDRAFKDAGIEPNPGTDPGLEG